MLEGTPPRTAAVSKHQTISGTQHEGASSRGGVRGGVYPPRHGCCVQASDYIWDPARGGVLEGGVPPPRHGCCVQASDYIWDPARGGVLEGGPGGGGLPSPGTAAVSKHQTISGTQHEGACPLLNAWLQELSN